MKQDFLKNKNEFEKRNEEKLKLFEDLKKNGATDAILKRISFELPELVLLELSEYETDYILKQHEFIELMSNLIDKKLTFGNVSLSIGPNGWGSWNYKNFVFDIETQKLKLVARNDSYQLVVGCVSPFSNKNIRIKLDGITGVYKGFYLDVDFDDELCISKMGLFGNGFGKGEVRDTGLFKFPGNISGKKVIECARTATKLWTEKPQE